jgi:hypothetical protein
MVNGAATRNDICVSEQSSLRNALGSIKLAGRPLKQAW